MPDNPNLRGRQDRERISLREAHEVSYWTNALGVSPEELVEAVQKAGNSAAAVRELLATRRH
ncbi:DUF3606 domain-containing protein [Caulobacter sp. 17J65-9]|uniref:DUF3606 domain-containing protein n=1 Tax=Caulobacter sp. 17J65-9 TaxID=2709382 RepID=UPI0013CAAAD8|nr:DUF3606 domain-containing protein [Caulobacter sp. 17J65-9]NEX91183.1 DUF3606 domain-containing protein [Caulobacter sp. 17J65-9]